MENALTVQLSFSTKRFLKEQAHSLKCLACLCKIKFARGIKGFSSLGLKSCAVFRLYRHGELAKKEDDGTNILLTRLQFCMKLGIFPEILVPSIRLHRYNQASNFLVKRVEIVKWTWTTKSTMDPTHLCFQLPPSDKLQPFLNSQFFFSFTE